MHRLIVRVGARSSWGCTPRMTGAFATASARTFRSTRAHSNAMPTTNAPKIHAPTPTAVPPVQPPPSVTPPPSSSASTGTKAGVGGGAGSERGSNGSGSDRGGGGSGNVSTDRVAPGVHAPVGTADVGLLKAVKRDHEEVRTLFKAAKRSDITDEQREAVVHDIIKNLSVHTAVEERVVYPAMNEMLYEGEKEYTTSLNEHRRQKELLKQLDGMKMTDPKLVLLLEELVRDTEAHMEEEETDRFPRLLQNVSEQGRQHLMQKYENAKTTAPSHPHPLAPDKGPLASVVQVAAAGVDALRDIGRSTVKGATIGDHEVSPTALGAGVVQKVQSKDTINKEKDAKQQK